MEEQRYLGPRLKHMNQLIKSNMDKTFTSLDLTAIQSFILHYMSTCEEAAVYPKDIEKRFNLTHPTVSGILQRMEAKGFIACTPDAADRRCKRLSVTEKARQCQREVCSAICKIESAMLDGFSEEEQSLYLSFIARTIRNLEKNDEKEESSI